MPTVYSPPVPTYAALATTTTASNDTSVVFSSIPATYRDLIVVANGKRSTNTAGVLVYLNGDTTQANYSRVVMYGNGTDDFSFANNESEFVYMDNGDTVFRVQLMDYSATDKHKTLLARSDETSKWTFAIAGRWANTAAVASIEFYSMSGYFVDGTTFSLYGIEA